VVEFRDVDGGDDDDDDCRLGLLLLDLPKGGNDFRFVDIDDDILSNGLLRDVSIGLGPASSATATDIDVDDCASVVVIVVVTVSSAALSLPRRVYWPIDDRGRLQQRCLLVSIFVTIFLRPPPPPLGS